VTTSASIVDERAAVEIESWTVVEVGTVKVSRPTAHSHRVDVIEPVLDAQPTSEQVDVSCADIQQSRGRTFVSSPQPISHLHRIQGHSKSRQNIRYSKALILQVNSPLGLDYPLRSVEFQVRIHPPLDKS
jgi:hypothetical protein